MTKHNFIYLNEVNSTNTYLLDNDLPTGTVLSTGKQLAGRGRSGRVWESHKGDNLMFSMILPTIPIDKLFLSQIVAGCSIVDTLRQYADVRLKWPNDVVCNSKKLVGMLIETRFSGNKLQKAVLGVGINVHSMPESLSAKATALHLITDKAIPPLKELLESAVANIDLAFDRFLNNDVDISAQWADYSACLMKTIAFHRGGVVEGVTEIGIQPDGSLIVRRADGGTDVISEGEIGYDFRF
ncbi:MAG: biotin--[acetyl-CoA-carboxylase] ligase [Deferribacteraceae bacterium]|nr:biotin--[acetyl-CoA-carboxylase] ligase [Deferribacteraceae bacterium]